MDVRLRARLTALAPPAQTARAVLSGLMLAVASWMCLYGLLVLGPARTILLDTLDVALMAVGAVACRRRGATNRVRTRGFVCVWVGGQVGGVCVCVLVTRLPWTARGSVCGCAVVVRGWVRVPLLS